MKNRTAYQDALDWLFTQSRGGAPREPARMLALAERLGLREPARSVHVAGTNGKGTVTSMIAAAAHAARQRAGAFISPHVEEFRERISVSGEPIPEERVVEFVDRVRSVRLPGTPAFFELTLAMALDHFAREGVGFAAFEAGVGARHDATAILEKVAVGVLTPIAMDHVDTLGPTLPDIATDKAAVMRSGRPAASAAQKPEVEGVLRAYADRFDAHLVMDGDDDRLFALPASAFDHLDPVRRQNARLAAASLRLLVDVPETAIAAGVSTPPLPGRAERFVVASPGSPQQTVEVLLDGAHDPAAAEALARRAAGPFLLLFGSLRRKQGLATLEQLERHARHVIVTSAGGEEISVPLGPGRTVVRYPADALACALAMARPGELLVIAGSLYLAGELRPLLRDPKRISPSVLCSAVNREAG